MDTLDFGARGCTDGISGEFRQRITAIPVGEEIEVVVRDPSARSDLPALCRMMGHDIVAQDERDGALHLRIKRGA